MPLIQQCFEHHPQDSRVKQTEVNPTLGTFGNSVEGKDTLIYETRTLAIQENLIGRGENAGPNGIGVQPELAYTLNTTGVGGVLPDRPTKRNARDGRESGGGIGKDGDPSMTLTSSLTPGVFTIDAERSNAMKSSNPDSGIHEAEIAKTIDASVPAPNKAQGGQMVCDRMTVRRLTTVECARLQGFPDHFTEIPWRGKLPEQCPKAPQYKAYGNSMCVNVMEWIGRMIEEELTNPSGVELEPPPEQLEFNF